MCKEDHPLYWEYNEDSEFKFAGFAELVVSLHSVINIVYFLFSYTVYFSIPYKYNRLLKTPKELEAAKKKNKSLKYDFFVWKNVLGTGYVVRVLLLIC